MKPPKRRMYCLHMTIRCPLRADGPFLVSILVQIWVLILNSHYCVIREIRRYPLRTHEVFVVVKRCLSRAGIFSSCNFRRLPSQQKLTHQISKYPLLRPSWEHRHLPHCFLGRASLATCILAIRPLRCHSAEWSCRMSPWSHRSTRQKEGKGGFLRARMRRLKETAEAMLQYVVAEALPKSLHLQQHSFITSATLYCM